MLFRSYYLIFTSFVLFTVTFVEHKDWHDSTGTQLKAEVARVGGILLIMGVLHAANVVALPIIGRLLSSNKRLDEGKSDHSPGTVPTIGAGTCCCASSPPRDPKVTTRTRRRALSRVAR